MYVDDACVGTDTIINVSQLQADLIFVLNKGELILSKWSNNIPEVLDAVPSDWRVSCLLLFDNKDGSDTKVLRLQWYSSEDVFRSVLRLEFLIIYTKRDLQSSIVKIFDPLDLFAPTKFYAKCIMQRTWRVKMEWDDPLSADVHQDCSLFVRELPSLCDLKVPRYLNSKRGSSYHLLGFCNASQNGYAAVIYVKVLRSNAPLTVHLIGTKTKLAPLQQLTILRLELNSVALLTQ